MSKRFFSLIREGSLHIAQKTKVIPGESFSVVLEAKELLDHVKEDAEQYKLKIAADCEKLKENAIKEGFEQGYSEWLDKIADLDEEIKKVRIDTEAVIIPIAMKAAKKIVGRELEISQKTVVDIISNSLKAVATHKRIKLYVNKKELELMEKHKEEIKKIFEHLETLSILSQEDIMPGGCIIETEGGIINAQLENQWLILENAFQKLIAPKKEGGREDAHKQEAALKDAKKATPSQAAPAEKAQAPASAKPPVPKAAPAQAKEKDEDEDWEDEEDEDWGEEDDEDWGEEEEKTGKK